MKRAGTPASASMMLSYQAVIAIIVVLHDRCQGASLPTDTIHFSIHNCHTQNQPHFELTCDPGHMIRIKRVFYGYSAAGNCFYHSGDCIAEEKSNYPCVGRQTCEINVPQVAGRIIRKCQKASNYFQVDYECVPISLTKNICEHGQLSDTTGYLRSPNYPLSHFNGPLQCRTKITAPLGYNIRLHIIDLDLRENGPTECTDSLSLIQLSGVTLCGRRRNEDIQLTPLNTMQITFLASAGKGNKGFWLYYEAYDTKSTTTTAKTMRSLPAELSEGDGRSDATKSNVQLPVEKSKQLPSSDESTKTNEDIPFAAIIGGVIGSLLLVLVILVALLLLKWWREQCEFRYRTQKKFREVRNNAFHSSNDLFPPVQMEV